MRKFFKNKGKWFGSLVVIFFITLQLSPFIAVAGTPITPGDPITPGTPINPGTSISPGTPIIPGTPIRPGDSITPGNPITPGHSIEGNSGNSGNGSVQQGNGNSNNGTSNHSSNSNDSSYEDDYQYDSGEFGPTDYDAYKWLNNDVIAGTFEYISDNEVYDYPSFTQHGGGLASMLLWSTYKVGVKGDTVLETIGDGGDFAIHGAEAYAQGKALYQYNQALRTATAGEGTLANINSLKSGLQMQHFAPLSKINVVAAGVGAGFAAYETGQNIGNVFQAENGTERALAFGDLGQSSGELLMNSSVLLAASGVGAPVAAGVFIAGAVLWGAGTITKMWVNRKKIWNDVKNTWNNVKDFASNVGEGIKDGWNKITSWF